MHPPTFTGTVLCRLIIAGAYPWPVHKIDPYKGHFPPLLQGQSYVN